MRFFQNAVFYLKFILSSGFLYKLLLEKALQVKQNDFSLYFQNLKKQLKKNQKGQVIVEYILLLVVSTVLALALINLVTVDPDKNSPLFRYWGHLLRVIGADIST